VAEADEGWVRVGTIAEVPEGEIRVFDIPGSRVAVANFENQPFAVANECTHAGCSLGEGSLSEEEAAVECPCHGSVFDLETGEPIEGPAEDPVAVWRARVVEDWIEVAPATR
jgi:3-phenylpropionate/trans-cinnamate dioxygenase ferredoxin subunit